MILVYKNLQIEPKGRRPWLRIWDELDIVDRPVRFNFAKDVYLYIYNIRWYQWKRDAHLYIYIVYYILYSLVPKAEGKKNTYIDLEPISRENSMSM